VWGGVNNFWNLKGRENDPDGPRFRFGLNDLRVYRFFNLLRAARHTEATFEQRRLENRLVEGDVVEVHRWRLTGPGGDELLDMPIVRGNLDAAAVETVTRDDLTGIVRLGREHHTPVVLFDYQPGRGQQHPQAFLSGWHGTLMSDGYSAWRTIEGVTHLLTAADQLSMQPTLASLARRLDTESFFQVSRNAIIRLDAVKEARPFSDGTGEILLANGQTMIVARRRWRALLDKLEA